MEKLAAEKTRVDLEWEKHHVLRKLKDQKCISYKGGVSRALSNKSHLSLISERVRIISDESCVLRATAQSP
jgi:hypothetical protein